MYNKLLGVRAYPYNLKSIKKQSDIWARILRHK